MTYGFKGMYARFCVLQLYQEFGATYKHWFEVLLPRSNQKLVTGHHPSNRSFKIVAECPVIGTAMHP